METFAAAWLELREPVDHRSRSEALARRLADWWGARRGSHVLDLGAGTGSNLRYLSRVLPGPQRWTLIDHDFDLLRRVRAPSDAVTVSRVTADLAAEGAYVVSGSQLVTASALLDLVSEQWLEGLVDSCVAAGCAALFSLTYDGRIEWQAPREVDRSPPHPSDERVRAAVNEHQRRDKGLGPALGPTAGSVAERLFRDRGYEVRTASTPWLLGPQDAGLVAALLRGWEEAAVDQRPEETDRALAWAKGKREMLDRREFRLMVGHVDLLALPTAPIRS